VETEKGDVCGTHSLALSRQERVRMGSEPGFKLGCPFVATSGMRLSFVAISKIHAVTPAGVLPGLSLFSKQSEIRSHAAGLPSKCSPR